MRAVPWLIVCLLALVPAASADPAAQTAPGAAIFYYPWYGTPARDGSYLHWQQNGHRPPADIASAFYPKRGAYSSADPGVVDTQLGEIARAGVGEVVVSWWGRGSPEDERLADLVRSPGAHSLRVAAHLEPYAGRTIASTVRDIAYLRTLGIRDFFVYRATDYPAEAWRVATAALDGVRLFAQTALAGYAKTAGFQGIYTYDTLTYGPRSLARICTQARDAGLLCAPSVGPGYNARRATGDTRTLRRRSGQTYDSYWRAALHARADIVTITSYNEWLEGTQIEPATQRSGYASYDGAWSKRGQAAENGYVDRTAYWTSRLLRKDTG